MYPRLDPLPAYLGSLALLLPRGPPLLDQRLRCASGLGLGLFPSGCRRKLGLVLSPEALLQVRLWATWLQGHRAAHLSC